MPLLAEPETATPLSEDLLGLPRLRASWRIGRTIVTVLAVELTILGLAAWPAVYVCTYVAHVTAGDAVVRAFAIATILAPAYGLFVFVLMTLTAAFTFLLGWRTPDAARMRIADLEPPLLRWACYMSAIHVVRIFAGSLVRGTPIWSAYLRLHGARVGRGVYVASVALSDYNLLDLGDGVVIGEGVHLSGHTVERGIVSTARVVLGRGVTIGVGSIVDVGAIVGAGTQVGALSFVPKYARLEPGAVYAGIPVRRIPHRQPAAGAASPDGTEGEPAHASIQHLP